MKLFSQFFHISGFNFLPVILLVSVGRILIYFPCSFLISAILFQSFSTSQPYPLRCFYIDQVRVMLIRVPRPITSWIGHIRRPENTVVLVHSTYCKYNFSFLVVQIEIASDAVIWQGWHKGFIAVQVLAI